MWTPDAGRRNGHRPRRCGAGTMAHRRCWDGRRWLGPLLGGLLLVLLLGGTVFVSNQVTGLRAEIARLEDEQEFQEAGAALLLARWNAATAPEVVRRRAASELQLFPFAEPGLVLVQRSGSQPGSRRLLRGLLEGIGGGEPARAAQAHTPTDRPALISLTPRSPRAAAAGAGAAELRR